jgi:hypothetical protein
MFVTGINLAHIPTIFLLDFETVLTVFLLNILLNFYSSIDVVTWIATFMRTNQFTLNSALTVLRLQA